MERVVKRLEYCIGCHPCPNCVYYDPDDLRCQKHLMRDALEVLKVRETVKPLIRIHNANKNNGTEYICGHCNGSFLHQHVKFYPWCGKEIKWND